MSEILSKTKRDFADAVDMPHSFRKVPPMHKALTVTQARSKLGHLVDQAAKGKPVYLRRGKNLLRLARIKEPARIPLRPFGYFSFNDDLTALANRAEPSFTPIDEN